MQALLLITIYKAFDRQGNGCVRKDHSFSDNTEVAAKKMQVKWLLFPLDHTLSAILIKLLSVSMATLSLTCRTLNSSKPCCGQWKSLCCHSDRDKTEQMRQELCTELARF